jgi:hypothetical protein
MSLKKKRRLHYAIIILGNIIATATTIQMNQYSVYAGARKEKKDEEARPRQPEAATERRGGGAGRQKKRTTQPGSQIPKFHVPTPLKKVSQSVVTLLLPAASSVCSAPLYVLSPTA